MGVEGPPEIGTDREELGDWRNFLFFYERRWTLTTHWKRGFDRTSDLGTSQTIHGSERVNNGSGGSFEAEEFSLYLPAQRKVAAAGRESLGGKLRWLVAVGNLFR